MKHLVPVALTLALSGCIGTANIINPDLSANVQVAATTGTTPGAYSQAAPPPVTLVNNGTINIIQQSQNVIQQNNNVSVGSTVNAVIPQANSPATLTTFDQPEFSISYPATVVPSQITVQQASQGVRWAIYGGGSGISIEIAPFQGTIENARASVESETGLQSVQDRSLTLGGQPAYQVRDFFTASDGTTSFGNVIVSVSGNVMALMIYTANSTVATTDADKGVTALQNIASTWVWHNISAPPPQTQPAINLPTATPTPQTVAATLAPTTAPTATPTPMPVATPTPAPVQTATPTPTPVPATPTPTPTPVATPTLFPSPENYTVHISRHTATPKDLTIIGGSTVTWINDDGLSHNIVAMADDMAAGRMAFPLDGLALDANGGSASFTFRVRGNVYGGYYDPGSCYHDPPSGCTGYEVDDGVPIEGSITILWPSS